MILLAGILTVVRLARRGGQVYYPERYNLQRIPKILKYYKQLISCERIIAVS